MKVAFLGLGRMGTAMAGHVRDAGHELTAWNRTPKEFPGVTVAGSVAEAVGDAEYVVLMLFGPDSVREVLTQVVTAAPKGTLIIDATTVGPAASREFAATAAKAGMRYIDAPVTGTVGPATAGTLGVLVGGSDADYADALPLLQLWGDPDRVLHVGPVGSGSALKVVVNQGLGVAAAGVGEALALAAHLGIDRGKALDVLEQGVYGWTLRQKRPALEASDFRNAQFSLDLLAKDLDLCLAESGGAEMRVSRAVLDDAREALGAGYSGQDYAALIGYLADRNRAS